MPSRERGLPRSPICRINRLQNTGLEHRVEVFADFNKNVLAFPSIVAIQFKNGMRRAAGTTKAVEDNAIRLRRVENEARHEVSVLGG
jgi:hypothetical protein